MSSQTRIDQYFKSISSNKTIICSEKKDYELLDRSVTRRKLTIKSTGGRSRNSKKKISSTPSNEKQIVRSRNSSTDNSVSSESTPKESAAFRKEFTKTISTSQFASSTEQSRTTYDSSLDVNPSTPQKKTVKGFAMACNSPRALRSSAKISLKRSIADAPGKSSRPEKLATLRKDVVEPCKMQTVGTTDENNSQSPFGQTVDTTQEPRVESFLKDDKIDDIAMENIDRSNFNDNNTKTTPKKRKIEDLESSTNSLTSNGWKVAYSIKTTIDESNDATKVSQDSDKVFPMENDCVKKASPCRALFTKKKIRIDDDNATTNLSSTRAKKDSTLSRDETSIPSTTIAASLIAPKKSDGTAIPSPKASGIAEPSTKKIRPSIASLEIIEPPVILKRVDGTAIPRMKDDATANSVARKIEPAIPLKEIMGSLNESRNIVDAQKSPMESIAIPDLRMELIAIPKSSIKSIAIPIPPMKSNAIPTSPKKSAAIPTTPKKSVAIPTTPKKSSTIPTSPIKSNAIPTSPKTPNAIPNVPIKSNAIPTFSKTSIAIPNSPIKSTAIPISPMKSNAIPTFPKTSSAIPNSPIKSTAIPNSSKKIIAIPASPIKSIAIPNSPKKSIAIPNSPRKSIAIPKTPTKTLNPPTTPTKSPSTGSSGKSSFSPRVKLSPQKPYKERLDTQLMARAIENLNQARQGIISSNDFDLEKIYENEKFIFEYGTLKTDTAVMYDVRDCRFPNEKHADFFLMIFANVFSEPVNCGYFDDVELDTIFSILTLSSEAQSLLARMLKRKRGWHRVPNIKYNDIAEDLEPIFKELVRHGCLDDDIVNEDISRSLSLLQAEEIRGVCQSMKISHKGTKVTQMSSLLKLSGRKKSLFPGMKTPSSALENKIRSMLGSCIRLPEKMENLLDRIFILLIPDQDPKENMAEAFRMLMQVHYGDKVFPETPNDRFPIFKDRNHLIRYAEARSAWHRIINAIEAKDWETVQTIGQLAYDQLKPYFDNNDKRTSTTVSTIPSHVKRFDPNYVWVKVMSRSVEGYKKSKETMATAAKFLHVLLSPSNDIPANRTRWYGELALIESYHLKNFETSAEVTIEALSQKRISEIDVAEILERARILSKNKILSTTVKDRLNLAVQLRQEMFISTGQPTVKEIEANMVSGNTTGSKSTWSVNMGGSDTGYLRVEHVAQLHYRSEGFRDGVHCEGALPITLFGTLLWDEIYKIPVPGAFVSSYQTAPLDIYTSKFFDNRRERIENKIKLVRCLDVDSLSDMMQEDYAKYRNYESLIHGNLFEEPENFKDFIECLGIDAVVGICERLAGNYNQWKSGFPDLALWNPVTKKCKIVEVKGPGDSLSTKQKLWIQFLESLGVDVEVCVVKGTTRRYPT